MISSPWRNFPKAMMKITNVKTTDGKTLRDHSNLTIIGNHLSLRWLPGACLTNLMANGKMVTTVRIKFDPNKIRLSSIALALNFEDLAEQANLR